MPKINRDHIMAVGLNDQLVGAMMHGDRDLYTSVTGQPYVNVGSHTIEVPYWASQITVAYTGGGGAGGDE